MTVPPCAPFDPNSLSTFPENSEAEPGSPTNVTFDDEGGEKRDSSQVDHSPLQLVLVTKLAYGVFYLPQTYEVYPTAMMARIAFFYSRGVLKSIPSLISISVPLSSCSSS